MAWSNEYVENLRAVHSANWAKKDREIENLRRELEGCATQEKKITDLMLQVTALEKERDAAREAAGEARANLNSALARALRAERARDSYKQTVNEWATQAD